MLSNPVPLELLVLDSWFCMLCNAVLLGLLLTRQLVVYAVKSFAPRVINARQLFLFAVKCCAPRVITREVIGCACCQMLCPYSYYCETVVYPV